MRTEPKPTRTLWFALIVWVGASVAALTLASPNVVTVRGATAHGYNVWLALVVGALGGLAFGWLSAQRVDGRKKRRRRRHRSSTVPPPLPPLTPTE